MSEKKGAIPVWLKEGFFRLGNHFLVKLLTRVLAKIGLGFAGPIGWIASFFIEKILKVVWGLVVIAYHKIFEKIETEKEVKKYEGVVNKPDATTEEKANAGKDFLNS